MKKIIVNMVLLALFAVATFVPADAQENQKSYIVMTNNDAQIGKILIELEKVGGTIDRLIPEIGVAVVSSSSETFAADAAQINGVSEVLPNIVVQWLSEVAPLV